MFFFFFLKKKNMLLFKIYYTVLTNISKAPNVAENFSKQFSCRWCFLLQLQTNRWHHFSTSPCVDKCVLYTPTSQLVLEFVSVSGPHSKGVSSWQQRLDRGPNLVEQDKVPQLHGALICKLTVHFTIPVSCCHFAVKIVCIIIKCVNKAEQL